MNNDRISEVYKGEIWTDALQQRAQRRIHWLCAQADGEVVLDVGCSQGIASILLGREGFRVTGIDIQPSRIEYACADLELEPEEIQDRVKFEVANGSNLRFDNDSFDTVILGEVIEHLAVPNRLLDEVRRVLKPGGVVAITTPFGLSPHHDHKQTFYPSRLWKMVGESLLIRTVSVVDNYFRIVAECPPSDVHESLLIDTRTADLLDDVWSTIDSDLRINRLKVVELDKRIGALTSQVDTEADKIVHQADEIVHQADEIVHQTDKIAHQTDKIAHQTDKIRDLKSRLVEGERHLATRTKMIADMDARLSASTARIAAQGQRIDHLEDDRAKLRDRLALARWKLTSTTSRKWWRIGIAMGKVRSNFLRIFVLPFDTVSILFSRSSLPERPQPTRPQTPNGAEDGSSLTSDADSSVSSKNGTRISPPGARGRSVTEHDDPSLLSMIVAAPPSMSLASPPITSVGDLRVASILDEMSHQSFAPECHLVTFGPHNWLEVLERERPNMLLVESAWRGNGGSWEYKIGSYAYPKSVGLPDLTAVIEWCRREGIPTVFWNKEDPIHFEKFKEAAALFDVVFTTDANMTDRYRNLQGVTDRVVGVLPFAAQPFIHNPVGTMTGRAPTPVFAGAYYRNRHQSRRAQLDMLLDAAMPFGLVIFDRMGGEVSDSFGFPERFQANIVGRLPYDEMVRVYRGHRLFLNVNSVSDSPTMFSRRVFELLASGTPVVSTSSTGVGQMFGGVVEIVETPAEATEAIARLVEDEKWWLDRSVRGIESVFQTNTYADRLSTIAEAAGLSVESPRQRVSVVMGPDFELGNSNFAGLGNVVELLSLADNGSSPSTVGGLPVRQIGASSGDGALDIRQAVSRASSGDWLAFANSAKDLRTLRSLTVATRVTPAEIYVPAPSWAQSHVYVDEYDVSGPSVVSRDFVDRTSWSPWQSSNGDAVAARVYAAPIVDD